MLSTTKLYPAKILLFGEYTVIQDSDSLAIPYYGFSANWAYSTESMDSKIYLLQYLNFLEKECAEIIDVKSCRAELEKGLFLHSTIPTGYGAGSSGSVVAAIYDAFAQDKKTDLKKLRPIFQQMESYFHGSSSGIDPLVSFLNNAIYFNKGTLEAIEINASHDILQNLYLYDSGKSRSTSPLVKWYKSQLEKNFFANMIKNELIPLNENIIQAFIKNNKKQFRAYFIKISKIQLEYFTEMISTSNIPEASDTINLRMKLCGAGGGGFYLIYTEEFINDKRLIPLSVT